MTARPRWSAAGLVALGTVLGVGPVSAQGAKAVEPLCERILPATSANRLTQHTDLILIARRAVPAAGGTCNYATGGKKMVFLVSVLDEKSHAAEHYARYKDQAEYRANQREVPGLGDAAFTGGTYEHEVVVRQGSRLILVASMIQFDHTTHAARAAVPRDALVGIAREVIGRL